MADAMKKWLRRECTSEGDMRMMLLLWDATPGNRSLKIVEIPIKTTLNNPDFPEK